MIAVMTIIMCLSANPEICAVKEVEVDAYSCLSRRRDLIDRHLPEGYAARRARCIPKSLAIGSPNVA